MGKHNEFGKKGEELAVNYLQEKGYTIRCTNYRYLKAELDIIAELEDVLAVVEVKSRSSAFLEHIAETVTKAKIKRIVMAADHYVVTHDLDRDVRFDIITIRKHKGSFEIEHLENAFYHF